MTLQKRAEGYEIQRLMAEQEITRRELAEKTGVDDSVISSALRGKERIGLENGRKVARALGVGVAELIGRNACGAGDGSVRLMAGQSKTVAYPESEHSGARSAGGERSELVSVAGLRNRRTFKDLTQSELARRSGVNRATVGQAEKKGRATRGTARLLAGALGVEMEELARKEQRSRFPEGERAAIARRERGSIPHAANSSPVATKEERGSVRVELSEAVLSRVDRFLDLLESALKGRRA